MTVRPAGVRLRAYAVGFGDCLLLTVAYAAALPDGRRERHVLVDCGSDDDGSLADVAAAVAEHCGGRLDVVVATSRRREHVRGFGDPAARSVLRPLRPAVVVRPWTDAPRAGLDAASRRVVARLATVSAAGVDRFAFDSDRDARRARQLAALATEDGGADRLLREWARAGRAEYARTGGTVELGDAVPGVRVEALGPADGEALTGPAGHWLPLAADDGLAPLVEQAPPEAERGALDVLAEPGGAGAAEWLLRTLNSRRLAQGLEIVQAFDDLLSETSAALLVTVGQRRLLLPGDARVPDRPALADVDVYKVARHGARAGTARTLLDRWRHRAAPLVSVLSTARGVPDEALVADLGRLGPVARTDALPDGVRWVDVEAPAEGTEPFTVST